MEGTALSTMDEAEVIAITDEVTGTSISAEESTATIMTDAVVLSTTSTSTKIMLFIPFVLVIIALYFILKRF